MVAGSSTASVDRACPQGKEAGYLSGLFAMVLFVVASPHTFPATQQIQGGPHRVQLVELYTSEGCSSCPPADRWLGSMLKARTLWSTFIPVAFHVDYWNALGWPDRFSSPRYSQRQRQYVRQGGVNTVYTPGFILDGQEWRSFFRNRDLPKPSREMVGVLSLHIDAPSLQVYYHPTEGLDLPDTLVLNLVLLGFDLQTEVKSGENRGRTLRHDFTVLTWQQENLPAVTSGYYARNTYLPFVPPSAQQGPAPPRQAVVAWLNRLETQHPIQAAGGLLAPRQLQ